MLSRLFKTAAVERFGKIQLWSFLWSRYTFYRSFNSWMKEKSSEPIYNFLLYSRISHSQHGRQVFKTMCIFIKMAHKIIIPQNPNTMSKTILWFPCLSVHRAKNKQIPYHEVHPFLSPSTILCSFHLHFFFLFFYSSFPPCSWPFCKVGSKVA